MDCTELFHGGEIGDEDASAVSTALAICREIWNDERFTASAVAKEFAQIHNGDDFGSARASALADALGELAGAGKRLERPTAHNIGKLFQKRLVDRPAWIKEDQTVAILRKIRGHQENQYWIELLAPSHAAYESSQADPGNKTKNNPDNPNNPRVRGTNGFGPGNLGKVGNGFGDFPGEKDLSRANDGKDPSSWSTRI